MTNLAFWVVVGIVGGILVGVFAPDLGVASKPGIDYFIKALKILIGPIIFLTIVSGIVGLESLKDLGSIGLKAFIYFEVVSTLALASGIFFGEVLRPGHGMNLDYTTLDPSSVDKYTHVDRDVGSMWSILKSAVPSDPISPFINSNTLQVLFMALVVAIVLSFLKHDYKKACLRPLEFVQHYVLKLLTWLMLFSPAAAFSAMAYLIGKFGLSSLFGMMELLAVMALASCFFIFVILGIICYFAKVNVFKFMRFISKEVLVVFATSSSETALAPLMQKLEAAGIHRGAVGLIIPTGYSFNLDCTNIYLSLSIIFLAQAFNIPLSFEHLISILIVLMITSKGAVGVTGSGFIVLAGTLAALPSTGIPVVTVAVLLGVDKFMSEMRAVGNLCGNAVGCLIVSIWDKKVDMEKFRYAIDHPEEFHFHA
ncbi:cation:dicarboxylase symporter family transporter [Campylobacter sp. RM9344]|uniref:Cation:dicarboxylase symporter family transporter n=1 Tax=Campylobacter californiensis TaxID=1032243 RepID=A0AAW3ZXK3_9BACT|nr:MULTISPECIES: cation:dicarboxylase symporter family transporter [unclassified Campylobacter]MBE2984700.1 cation:dicarboxylase symporter family transporter [Campylobacter sp. RM6883]MBE2994616.1 cation:dicarboxylase symporter family transporter [Campylobacter sp. RM6913]MBE3021480.1 cation:dicarboxylase symporter family transporter [Campylobacter sp. 7477a]MBE3029142.1 cation:dicarboxylase symporter family transporter [Campylobacter sp. RM9344]MBE3605703.1 cation:dicarboxylase symporter fami